MFTSFDSLRQYLLRYLTFGLFIRFMPTFFVAAKLNYEPKRLAIGEKTFVGMRENFQSLGIARFILTSKIKICLGAIPESLASLHH